MENTQHNHDDHGHEHGHEAPASADAGDKPLMTLTERAVKKVVSFSENNKDAEGKSLRIYVQGGGCSGFEYGFTFDDMRDDDQVLEQDGVKVFLDPISLPYLQNSVLDYVEDFRGSGFAVKNPNATGSCGCGHSFSV